MKKNLRLWMVGALGVAALAFTSCAYDPYNSSSYGSGSYSTGYGSGYGYGGSSFNTSLFVSTGSPRWGYDPYCYSYYDFSSRRYYDPYLYGYYPVGYRPPVVYGVPHPHGWRPGRGYISPPSRITSRTLPNYHHRDSAYRSSDYSWARQVRQQDQRPGRSASQGGTRQGSLDTPSDRGRPGYGSRVTEGSGWDRTRQSQGRESRESVRPSTRPQAPSRYNSPVTQIEQPRQSTGGGFDRTNEGQRPQLGVPRESPQRELRAPNPPERRERPERSATPDFGRQSMQRPEARGASPQPQFQPQAQPQIQRPSQAQERGRGRSTPGVTNEEGQGRQAR